MAITTKKPPMKLTVGAQYICFNTMSQDNDWTETFDSEVTKLPTVTEVQVSDESDTHESYASGDIYDADTQISSINIETTNLAFPDLLLAQMRGANITGGAVLDGGVTIRPFFAYGIVVKKKDGSLDMRWYPKCKLSENSDNSQTSEASWNDQTDTITITAMGFDEDSNKVVQCLTSETNVQNVTEDKFFAAPLLTAASVVALNS